MRDGKNGLGDNKMALYITGDTHYPIDFNKVRKWVKTKELTEDDILLICGDAGFVWSDTKAEQKNIDKLAEEFPFTFVYVDGNHENFWALQKRPQIEKFGGPVNVISKNIFRLQRGYVYNICGKSIFAMGGAHSIDRANRVEGFSWWAEEALSSEDKERGVAALEYFGEVDYIVTHAAPDEVVRALFKFEIDNDDIRKYFSFIMKNFKYGLWYCGHYHFDRYFEECKVRLMYEDVLPIGEV